MKWWIWFILLMLIAGIVGGVAIGWIKVWWLVLGIAVMAGLPVVVAGTLVLVCLWLGRVPDLVAWPLSFPVRWLADRNLCLVYKKENTARIILRGGAFEKLLVHWKGYIADEEGKIKEGKAPEKLLDTFGVEFYGIWPILDVGIIHLRWWDLHLTEEGEEKPEFHEEDQDFVLLKPDVYWIEVKAAETKPPERWPVTVGFVVTMRVVNPHNAVFVAPINWTENVMIRLGALFRTYISTKEFDDLQQLSSVEIWKDLHIETEAEVEEGEEAPAGKEQEEEKIQVELGGRELIQGTLEEKWGIKVEEKGIEIKRIDLDPEYQRAAAAERTEGMRAAGERERIRAVYKTIGEFKDLGRLIRTLEAAEKSPLAATMTLQAIPGLPELLRGVFGRPPEDITLRELAELRKVVQDLSQRVEGLSTQGNPGSRGSPGGRGARDRRGYNRRK